MLNYHISGESDEWLALFVHGGGVGAWMWEQQVKGLENIRCLNFDLPGHGENSSMPFLSIRDCADQIGILIDKEAQGRKVLLAGHSIGAQIGTHLIDEAVPFIDKYIIISALNYGRRLPQWLLKGSLYPLMPLIRMRKYARLQARQLCLPDFLFEDYFRDSQLISSLSLVNMIRENMAFRFSGSTGGGRNVLLLAGDREVGLIKKSMDRNRHLLPEASAFMVAGAAHGIPYEKGALLNNLIGDFVKERPLGRDGLISM